MIVILKSTIEADVKLGNYVIIMFPSIERGYIFMYVVLRDLHVHRTSQWSFNRDVRLIRK